jgi:hypothetical protein
MATLIFNMADDFSLIQDQNTDSNFENIKYYCPNSIEKKSNNLNNYKQPNFKKGYQAITVADEDGFLRLQLVPVAINY